MPLGRRGGLRLQLLLRHDRPALRPHRAQRLARDAAGRRGAQPDRTRPRHVHRRTRAEPLRGPQTHRPAGDEGAAGAGQPPLATTAARPASGLSGLPRRPGPVHHGPAQGRQHPHRSPQRATGGQRRRAAALLPGRHAVLPPGRGLRQPFAVRHQPRRQPRRAGDLDPVHPQYSAGALPRPALRRRPQLHPVLRDPEPRALLRRPARPAAADAVDRCRVAVQRRAVAGPGGQQPVHPLRPPRLLAGADRRADGAPVRRAAGQLPGLLQQLCLPAPGAR
ncbi:hypothetical protein FQZ97_884970 [compost metagenome]